MEWIHLLITVSLLKFHTETYELEPVTTFDGIAITSLATTREDLYLIIDLGRLYRANIEREDFTAISPGPSLCLMVDDHRTHAFALFCVAERCLIGGTRHAPGLCGDPAPATL